MSKQETTFLHATRAWCAQCNQVEMARVVADQQGVFLERMCTKNGTRRIKIAASSAWYRERAGKPMQIEEIPDRKKVQHGCPLDCGICGWHVTGLHLPVFSITNDCNLNCPKCFTYNRPDRKYYKTTDETRAILRHIKKKQPNIQLINMTGGEPSLHPNLFDLIALCREEGISRITMNTNGLKIAADVPFAEQIKEAGIQLVLSLDTLLPEKSVIIYGQDIVAEKKKALELLEALDIPTTLLLVCVKGVNENDVATSLRSILKRNLLKASQYRI